MQQATPTSTLSGPEKAAILMLAVPQDSAAKLCELLEIEEVKEISQTMSVLGKVRSEIVESLLEEFGDRLDRAGGVAGGYDATERLLARFLDRDRVDSIMADVRGPAGRTVWDKLGNVNESVLAAFLKNEYPQTVAVVLSRIDAAHSARVLGQLPEDFAVDVIMRMLRMEVVQREVLVDVERTLRSEFMNHLARTTRRDNHEVMAEIFNFFDRATESRFITSLEERSREAAERIKALMFTFDDLTRIDSAGIQLLLRNAGNDRIGLALKGASEPIRELFFSNMSERGARILKEEIESMGPVRRRDVEESQQFLVGMAKELAASGEILLVDAKEDELIY